MRHELKPFAWVRISYRLLTLRRIHAHALILSFCLWVAFAVDYSTHRPLDRAGNIKFQDFLSFYISGELISRGHSSALYDESLRYSEMLTIAAPAKPLPDPHPPGNVRIPNLYGPQVGLMFAPFARMPFLWAAVLWLVFSFLIYFGCVYAISRRYSAIRPHRATVALAALAFPPFWHCMIRGQLSALLLLCFTIGFFALRANRQLLAGIALGLLVFKPQFLLAIPLILILAGSWRMLAGLLMSSAIQVGSTCLYFESAVMQTYIDMLRNLPRWIRIAEPGFSLVQMHSLRSFWELLIPWPSAAWILYILTSIAVLVIATVIWKAPLSLEVRYSALILAAVLVNPHIYIYDLLALAPALLLLADWSIHNADDAHKPALVVLLYLAFLLPLFGPLAHWTHLQLSVIVFALLLWTLRQMGDTKMLQP
jgi:hypothetical protein